MVPMFPVWFQGPILWLPGSLLYMVPRFSPQVFFYNMVSKFMVWLSVSPVANPGKCLIVSKIEIKIIHTMFAKIHRIFAKFDNPFFAILS